jgi:hypothetical protein
LGARVDPLPKICFALGHCSVFTRVSSENRRIRERNSSHSYLPRGVISGRECEG